MKLCKDCRYAMPDKAFHRQTFWMRQVPTESSWKYAKCTHPNANDEGYALVTGHDADPKSCYTMRHDFYHYASSKGGEYRDESTCGKDAHWFEARPA